MGELVVDRVQKLETAANDYLDWSTILSEAGCRDIQNLQGQLLTTCPFHPDKRPSFRVVEEAGYYHCFSCGDAGSKLKLLFKTSNTSMKKAQFYEQFLKSNVYLQRQLGFTSLFLDSKTLPAEFEKRRKFSAKDHIGSSTPISVLSRKVRNGGDTWSRLVWSLTLLQSEESTTSVEYALCNGQKLQAPSVQVEEKSLEDLLSEEGLFQDD